MTIKIDFEFKKGDYVELAGMSEVQVGAIMKHFEDLDYKTDWFSADLEDATGLCVELDTIWLNRFTTEDVTGMEDVRKLTIKDIFPASEQEFDTDMESCKISLEETIAGFNLQAPTTWYCFKEVAATLGKEDAEYELGKVLRQINDGEITSNDLGADLNLLEDSLLYAFPWNETAQGNSFWNNIDDGKKPEGYDSTPDTPPTPEIDKKATPALKELMKLTKDNVEGSLEVRSQTLGELVEAIQLNIPEHVGVHFQPDGEVLLEADNAYVVVSELTAKEIDSAIEFVAHYGHLVIGKNDVQD